MKETIVLQGKPQQKQREFFLSCDKYIAYGGARGGGKSWALRRKLVLLALEYRGISILLIRRTYAELRDNHLRPLQSELSSFCRYTDTRKTFEFPGGSRIRLGYLDSESDVLQYQGQEYDIIAIDEATQLTEYQFHTLKGCLRGANSFPKRMYLTCNPGGVGHGWVKRLFIDRKYREGEKESEYRFIQALVYDNHILLEKNPDYLDQLKSLPSSLKNAWLNGDWQQFEGQFFSEFDENLHTVEKYDVGDNVKKYCAIDYGLDMFAAVFVAVDEKGNSVVYDEIHKDNLIVSQAAKLLAEKSKDVCMFIAPGDLWSRQKDSGKSIAELFANCGIYLYKLSSERIDGWMCLKELFKLKENKNGTFSPTLTIMRNCTNLIRCIPLLMHDTRRIGDVSTKPHDITHAPDALRYFAVSRYGNAISAKQSSPEKLTQKLKRNKK